MIETLFFFVLILVTMMQRPSAPTTRTVSQDLLFQETANTENFQARYIITHPATSSRGRMRKDPFLPGDLMQGPRWPWSKRKRWFRDLGHFVRNARVDLSGLF